MEGHVLPIAYSHPSPPNSSSQTLSTVSAENFPISHSTSCCVEVKGFGDDRCFWRNLVRCLSMPSNALIASLTSSHPSTVSWN